MEQSKKTYTKENITKYGKEKGFSDEQIEEVYLRAKQKLYDAEDSLNNIKEKVDNIRYATEDDEEE